jgi:hypothetical protein
MVKTIRLPEVIYEDLSSISKKLSSIAKKPISHAMTISLIIAVYRARLRDPCARDAFQQRIASLDFMSPEDFEKTWDNLPNKLKENIK